MAFTSIQKIRFDDVDGAGIVYYPRFFHLCHAAFEDFFDREGPYSYPVMIRERRLGFPTVHLDADFKAPLAYGDVARVTFVITALGNSSMKARYQIVRERDEAVAFICEITTVLISLDTQRPLPLDGELRDALVRHVAK